MFTVQQEKWVAVTTEGTIFPLAICQEERKRLITILTESDFFAAVTTRLVKREDTIVDTVENIAINEFC